MTIEVSEAVIANAFVSEVLFSELLRLHRTNIRLHRTNNLRRYQKHINALWDNYNKSIGMWMAHRLVSLSENE